jgi:putative ABC transport system substrate-binding protein
VKRRQFITLLGGTAAAWPVGARAQQALPVIGFLNGQSADTYSHLAAAFRQGLQEAGFTDGENVAIEYRWAEGRDERLPALASELIGLRIAVLISGGGVGVAKAAKAATTTVPIVFTTGSDPVKVGLVASLNRPSGNATGVSFLVNQLNAKRLELARQIMPTGAFMGLLVRPSNPAYEFDKKEIEAAAEKLGQKLLILTVESDRDFETAFAIAKQARVGAVMVHTDPFFNSNRESLVALAARHALPTLYELREKI